ncbi:hypothetical protein K1X76_11550, partial [bacterium]|nr:hypothetical protein [bacterium]
YGIAQHKEHHHNYPTHIPFFWFVTGLFALFCCDKKSSRISWLVFLINVFIHLALDTIVGEIAWAFPITRHKFVWFSVPNAYDWWVLNFVGHWTFLFELTLVIWAIILIKRYKFDLSKNQPFDKR